MVPEQPDHPLTELRVLGPVEVVVDDTQVPVPAGAQRSLLAALLVARGHAVPLSRLIDVLWPEDPPQDPRASLHTAVARLRRTLEGSGCTVRTAPPGYALDVPVASIDADRFSHLHARARRLLAPGDGPSDGTGPAEAAALLQSALDLWRGPAWGEFADGVASGEALSLEEARLAAHEDLATAALAAGRPGEAVAALEPVVAEHPLRDRAVGLLVDALHRYGRTADALECYRHYQELLADELGLDPSPGLAALHQRVLRQELPVSPPKDGPPRAGPVIASPPSVAGPSVAETSATRPTVAGLGPRTGGGRAAGSPLVGREQDAAEVTGLLESATLLTLVGPGGVGKTRLAQHVAERYLTDRPTPLRWVDLVPVRDRDGVVQALADGLGVDPAPGRSVEAAVRERLATRRELVVLDNCEHVLTAVADVLAAALPAGPVLATSRERIGVAGERVFVVGPLRLPPPETVDPEAPSVALFLERAREAGVDLGHDDAVLRRVGDICRSLDGLPLALELGAARIGTLSLDDLADRLDRRFELLTRGPRSAPTRHRTLRAVVDWSYDLLEEEEKAVFARLAVFPSGFDLSAAEAVVADEGVVEPARLADVVAALADRSMVVRPSAIGPGRYRLLESLRQYALSRLTSEELAGVRRSHASWVVRIAEDARPGLEGPEEGRWSRLLDERLEDLRAAWRWAWQAQDFATADRLVAATWRWAHWRLRNDLMRWGSELLDRRGEAATEEAYPAALGGAWLEGDVDRALRVAELAERRPIGEVTRAHLDEIVGDVHLSRSLVEEALASYERSAVVHERHGDRLYQALGTANQALALTYAGRPVGDALDVALDLAARTGNPTAWAFARFTEGEVWAEEDPRRAAAALEDAVTLADEVGNRLISGVAMTALVSMHGRSVDVAPDTFDRFGRVVVQWATVRNPMLLVTALRNLVVLLGQVGREAEAVELWAAVEGVDAGHPSYGAEADRLGAVLESARRHLGPAYDDAVVRGRSHHGMEAVARLAERLCANGAEDRNATGAGLGAPHQAVLDGALSLPVEGS